MRKIIFEIVQVILAYAIITIYGYYNTPEPDNKYSWLISAIIIIIIYSIIKLTSKKRKNNPLTLIVFIIDCYALFLGGKGVRFSA